MTTLASAFDSKQESNAATNGGHPYACLIAKDAYNTKQLFETIDVLAKTKLGKELLDSAVEYGTTIAYESINAHGSFNDETNAVLLRGSDPFDRSVVTLAHELRHSQQFQKGVLLNALLDAPKTYLQSQWTIEADANVAACVVGWELKEQGNDKPFEKFKEDRRDLAGAFEKDALAGDMGGARKAAFYTWFDDKSIRVAYEKNYLKNWEARDRKATREERDMSFKRAVPVQENIAKICLLDGKGYLPEKETDEFFKKPEQNQVTHETWWAIVRNVARSKPGFYMENIEAVKSEMESPAGLAINQGGYYDAKLTERQKQAAGKIGEYRSLNKLTGMRTNGTKFADVSRAALVKKRSMIQK